MLIRRPAPPRTPEENRARNIARIVNPPRPTLGDHIARGAHHVRSWWWRRRHPQLAEMLDRALLIRPAPATRTEAEDRWERLLRDLNGAGLDEPEPRP